MGVAVLRDGSWSSAREQTIHFARTNRRALGSGDEVGTFLIDPPESPLHDVRLGFALALRLVDDSEAAVYAPFDFVEWAMTGAVRYVEFAVLRRLAPLFAEPRPDALTARNVG